ncbi:MAG: type IV-A pilus assembly ATPase PilB [Gammaproteobacteria bacterium]
MATPAEKASLSGLARHLVGRGILEADQAGIAQHGAYEAKMSLVSYLVQQGMVKADEFAKILSEEFSVPLINLDSVHIDLEIAQKVGEDLIRRHRAIPFFNRGKRLYVATSDPTNGKALDELKFHTGLIVEPIVCADDKLDQHLEGVLQAVDTSLDALGLGEDQDLGGLGLEADGRDDTENPDAAAAIAEDAPVVQYVNKILLQAIRSGASDIHFEPYEKYYRVRLRIDGVLQEINRPPVHLKENLAAVLKVKSRLDVAERRKPQDGRTKMRLSRSRTMDFRVSCIPTAWGEKIVLRLLDPASASLGVEALGFDTLQNKRFSKALSQPHGMILVTGPTGSGKTVTLYTAVQILNTTERNISTAEDPIEIQLAGINQLEVNPKIDLTFAGALRAFLRQDPDVILVGEIRDYETAEIAVKAAQTGHLVLSTLHTNDAPKTLTRLRDIGLPPYSIASSVNLIVAQRLVRRLCKSCRKPLDIPAEALREEGFSDKEIEEGLHIFGPVGCNQCTLGYKGRVGIFEVLPMTEAMQHAILTDASDQAIAHLARDEGIQDMRRSGLDKVKAGETSLEEVRRVTTS